GEVQTLMEEDAYGAFVKMVEGLEMVEAEGGNLDQTLRDIGITEIRQLDVMKRLVGSSDILTDAQKTANGAWTENTALIEKANARYETFASTMQNVWNSVRDTFANIGNAFAQSGDGIIGKVQEVVQNIEKMTGSFIDAEGGITQTGQRFVAVATTIGGITTVLGIAAAAVMAFGPAGSVTVGVVAGLGVIIAYRADLVDEVYPIKSGITSASDQ